MHAVRIGIDRLMLAQFVDGTEDRVGIDTQR